MHTKSGRFLSAAKTLILNATLVGIVAACSSSDPVVVDDPSVSDQRVTPSKAEVRKAADVDGARIIAADSEPGNWMSHGRTYDEQRFSPLRSIDKANVDKLGLAWSYDFGTKRGIEATSIVVDGVMYATSTWSIVHALDARTGKELWTYDPKVPKEVGKFACCDAVNRGVAAWQGKIYVGTLDGRLVALDAKTGEKVWEVTTVDTTKPYTITGAPRIVKGKVFIGNGGAEYGVRGYISAYDVNDGSMIWRFYTVPGNPDDGFENDAMKMAADTWKGEWWKIGGGGTVWDSMAYDPDLDLLYIGVGNGTPWNQDIRSPGGGDNLFLSSIVALRPDTGEYVWHYQTTPGETWDYTAAQHIILADMEIKGEQRKVLMQAPKNGFFYVLDRATGELLSAEKYIGLNWATHVDMETGRPVEVPEARYPGKEPFMVLPSYLGGHNWHPMSYSPDTGLVYIPVLDFPALYGDEPEFKYRPGLNNLGIDMVISGLPDSQVERDTIRPLIKGRLVAWDPKTQKEAWRVEHKGAWNGGTLSTAGGIVFQGTADGEFVAFDATNGEKLWAFPAQTGIVAPPTTFEVDGEQYVSVNVGWGGVFALVFGEFVQSESVPNISRVLTFKLDANGQLPAVDWQPSVAFNPPEQNTSKGDTKKGLRLFQDTCMGCHGLNAVSGLTIPDLRGSGFIHDEKALQTVVLEGVLKENGMPAFSGDLTGEEVEHIRAYLIEQAWRGLNLQKEREKASAKPG